MNIGFFVVIIVIGVGTAVATLRLPRLWKTGGYDIESGFRGWWPYGDRSLKGWVRALPTSVAGAWALVIALIGMTISQVTSGPTHEVATNVAIAASVGMFLAVPIIITIIVFNRPRFLVPPPRRNEPGIIVVSRSGNRQR